MNKTELIEETLEALHDEVKTGRVRQLDTASVHTWEFSKVLHLPWLDIFRERRAFERSSSQ